jgi:hypothetical protein
MLHEECYDQKCVTDVLEEMLEGIQEVAVQLGYQLGLD